MSEKNSGRESYYMNALKYQITEKKKIPKIETKPVEGQKEEKPISRPCWSSSNAVGVVRMISFYR